MGWSSFPKLYFSKHVAKKHLISYSRKANQIIKRTDVIWNISQETPP